MSAPLAARLRPQTFETFVGQSHVVGKNSPFRVCIEKGQLHSMIFWGPPGSGKTTLAELIAKYCHAEFIPLSAVMAGVKDIREAMAQAQENRAKGVSSILFVDEIHRFNKSQQDALLPYVENGTVYLIGATTENPSFEIINALLSRTRVYVLKPLTNDELKQILINSLNSVEEEADISALKEEDEILDSIVLSADGDARRLLNNLELILQRINVKPKKALSKSLIEDILKQDYRRFDKQGDVFYDQISALHKSVRGSSPDGALYWLCRMLDGGCDPQYIARRVLRMASEDIGNADPRAITLAVDVWQTLERLGNPEGELALAQAVVYMACAPKSNAVYTAYKAMMQDVKNQPSYPVPIHIRNAPTALMKGMGHGKAYRYDHDEPEAFAAGQTYFPPEIGEKQYYYPVERGLEIKIAEKLAHLRELSKQRK